MTPLTPMASPDLTGPAPAVAGGTAGGMAAASPAPMAPVPPAALNVGLNLLLIPRWGIDGAAVATLLAHALMVLMAARLGRRTISIRPDGRRILVFVMAAAVMHGLLLQIDLADDLQTLLARIMAGLVIYPTLVISVDRQSRALALQAAARLGLMKGRS